VLRGVEGFLSEREAEWLYVTAAGGPGNGVVVEIGSFKGRSTIALAKGSEVRGGGGKVIAIDPHCAPSRTDPALRELRSSEPELRTNLARAGVAHMVDVRVQYSEDAAREWNLPIRLLWLDGDHTLTGVGADYDYWTPHLTEGGIIAMHDVLHRFEGPAPIFLQRVLAAPGWRDIGFIKSIGFATKDRGLDLTGRGRTKLQRALLQRMIEFSGCPDRSARMRYNLHRALLHHV
jgi:predicted O-methyltransferase YrrM